MSDYHGHGNCLLCPFVPLINVQVGAANASVCDTDQDVIDTVSWLRYVEQFETRSVPCFDQSFQCASGFLGVICIGLLITFTLGYVRGSRQCGQLLRRGSLDERLQLFQGFIPLAANSLKEIGRFYQRSRM